MRRHLVRIERDPVPLGQRAQLACGDVLDAVACAPSRVRRLVRVELRDGDLIVVARGWRLRFGADPEMLTVTVVRSPARDHHRRRAITAERSCARLESEPWISWLLHVVTSSGPAWLTLRAFHLDPQAGRKAA